MRAMKAMTATTLTAYIDGIGALGPGFADWTDLRAILAGEQPYQAAATVLPSPSLLPAAERRRSGAIVRLTLATGLEALAAAGLSAASLPSVFSSSGGDGENCHAICAALASDDPLDRQISPTRFHNSVHNTAAGYWGIATGSMTPASVLSAFDASFGAGLLEALTQTLVDATPCLLLACDTAYPEPLNSARPLPDAFGIALVLSPQRSARALARIDVTLSEASEEGDESLDRLADPALETLRRSIPAARGLPLLSAIAVGAARKVVLDYLDGTRLAVALTPC